jgi:hypothetical protein
MRQRGWRAAALAAATWPLAGVARAEPAYVTFALGADGRIDRIVMRAVSPRADFSFDYHDLDFRPAARPGKP